MSSPDPSNAGLPFGAFLIAHDMVAADELEAALELQDRRNDRIGSLAFRKNLLTFEKICAIRQYQRNREVPFGMAAVELGYLSEAEVEQLLGQQAHSHIRIGELLVELQFLTRGELKRCLRAYAEDVAPKAPAKPRVRPAVNGHRQ